VADIPQKKFDGIIESILDDDDPAAILTLGGRLLGALCAPPRIVATRRRNVPADLRVQLLEVSCRAALRKPPLTPVHELDQRVRIAHRVLGPKP